mgnify:CR=1 FL=1
MKRIAFVSALIFGIMVTASAQTKKPVTVKIQTPTVQCDECKQKYDGCCSIECKETIHLPLERQKEIRKGIDKGRNVFNKSKARWRPRLNE